MAAQGVYAAARHAHITEQQLDHRHGANVLRADGVLRPAQCVQERRGFIRSAGFRNVLADFQEVRFWRPADIFDNFWRIAGNVLLQQIPDAARMLQRGIAFSKAVFIQLIVPGRFVVLAGFGVIAAE